MAQFEAYLHNAYLDWQRQRAYDSIALLYRLRGDMQQAREVARNAPNGDISVLLALDDRNVALANQILFRRPLSNERGRRITQRFQLDLYGERAMAEGKTAEGLDYFRQTLEARVPIWSLDWYEDCLAGAYARIGQTQEAIAEYQRVLTRFPKLAMSWYRLGAIYEKKGMDSQSEAAMRTFLDLWKNADDDIPERIAAQEFLTRRTAAARTAARAW
jgi:tetratricopeptide (TPR) repeat protein